MGHDTPWPGIWREYLARDALTRVLSVKGRRGEG
jgi:hypothetical protein